MSGLERFLKILGLRLLQRLIARAIARLRGPTNQEAEEAASSMGTPGTRYVPAPPTNKGGAFRNVKAKPGKARNRGKERG